MSLLADTFHRITGTAQFTEERRFHLESFAERHFQTCIHRLQRHPNCKLTFAQDGFCNRLRSWQQLSKRHNIGYQTDSKRFLRIDWVSGKN